MTEACAGIGRSYYLSSRSGLAEVRECEILLNEAATCTTLQVYSEGKGPI